MAAAGSNSLVPGRYTGSQPSARRATLRIAAGANPARYRGGPAFCAGLSSARVASTDQYLPWYSAGSVVHSAWSASRHSSSRAPRSVMGTPAAWYSSGDQPMPRPTSSRPPLKRSMLVRELNRIGAITTGRADRG